MGIACSGTSELVFENLRVPSANLLHTENDGFKVAMGPAPRSSPFGNSYKADFQVPVTKDFTRVVIPFGNFSSSWSAYTGEPTKTCASDPSVCPDAAHLSKLSSLEITAEGVAGKFHLEVKSIAAVL